MATPVRPGIGNVNTQIYRQTAFQKVSAAPHFRPLSLYAAAESRTDFSGCFDEHRMFAMKNLLSTAGVSEGEHVIEIGCGRSADIPVLASLLGARVTACDPSDEYLQCARQAASDFLLAPKGDAGERAAFRDCFDRITWLSGDAGNLLYMKDLAPARAVVMEGLIDPFTSLPNCGVIHKYSGSDIELFLNRAYGFLSRPASLFVGVFQLPEDVQYFTDVIADSASAKQDLNMEPSYRVIPRSPSTIWDGPEICQMFLLKRE